MLENYSVGESIFPKKRYILMGLIVILVVLATALVLDVRRLQGTARVINYSGLVRGTTQRVVKLELVEESKDLLIKEIDIVLNGLQNTSEKYNLVKLEDVHFQRNLSIQKEMWEDLKTEIYNARNYGYENTNLILVSEEYFKQSDKTVNSAEDYSQKIASNILMLEIGILIVIGFIIAYLLHEIYIGVRIVRKKRYLEKLAYIDFHTKLPNKSRCTELISDLTLIEITTGVIIFDLNCLKQINDSLGHISGDSYIKEFARIIRQNIPREHFVGRFGGDEFIAITYGLKENQINDFIFEIQNGVDIYNEFRGQANLSFSYGYELSTNVKDCTLQDLLERADKNMYLYKKKLKNEIDNNEFLAENI